MNMFSFFSCSDHHYNIVCPEMTIERKTPCLDETETFRTFTICGCLPWRFEPLEPGCEGSRVKGRRTSLHIQNVLPVLSPASCSLYLWKWGLQVNVQLLILRLLGGNPLCQKTQLQMIQAKSCSRCCYSLLLPEKASLSSEFSLMWGTLRKCPLKVI